MSYEIIRSIKIKEGKVFLHSTCNNVRPYDWGEWECSGLTKILSESGRAALDLEILKNYEEGNFQRGKNKYTRAVEILRHYPEYKPFDWRGNDFEQICQRRKSPAFLDLLRRALSDRLPTDKYILLKPYGGSFAYLHKVTKRFAKFTYDKAKAKIFTWEEDAEWLKRCFHDSETWSVEKL